MHLSATDKDSEIIKLNIHLAGEKKKAQDVMNRASRGKLVGSNSQKSHSLDTRNRLENKLYNGNSPQIEYNFENTTGILGMTDDGFVATQKYMQLQEETEVYATENKQLKKKVETLKK